MYVFFFFVQSRSWHFPTLAKMVSTWMEYLTAKWASVELLILCKICLCVRVCMSSQSHSDEKKVWKKSPQTKWPLDILYLKRKTTHGFIYSILCRTFQWQSQKYAFFLRGNLIFRCFRVQWSSLTDEIFYKNILPFFDGPVKWYESDCVAVYVCVCRLWNICIEVENQYFIHYGILILMGRGQWATMTAIKPMVCAVYIPKNYKIIYKGVIWTYLLLLTVRGYCWNTYGKKAEPIYNTI